MSDVVGRELASAVQYSAVETTPRYLTSTSLAGSEYHVLVHRIGDNWVVELEDAIDREPVAFDVIYPVLQSTLGQLVATSGIEGACQAAAAQVRQITGFDRVLVYQFDPDWNGIVVAEDGNGRLPSYLGQRFPASDIPAQARELYRLNPIRQIPDANYEPVQLAPSVGNGGQVLDLTFASLRSVSPVHVEYMRNMGTGASMSVSIVMGDQLWGLISCHHAQPRRTSFHVRTACSFLAQVLSQHIVAQTHGDRYSQRLMLKTFQSQLLAQMAAAPDFLSGLAADPDALLKLASSPGAAIVSTERCHLIGVTPTEDQVRKIGRWLEEQSEPEVYATHHLASVFPAAAQFTDVASGLLAVSISKLHTRYLLWFRPEVVRTLNWAGDPTKSGPDVHTGRIHPRKSFDAWKQVVRHTSIPWSEAEIEAATELRNNVVGIVLRKAEELAEISGELERSNKELEAFSYSVSHDLRAPFRHIVGYAELLRQDESTGLSDSGRRYVDTIVESAHYAGTLVDNLLTFSQMGRSSLTLTDVNLRHLFTEGWRELKPDIGSRNIKFILDDLPTVWGDLMMLRLVVQNLLSNAVKYTRNTAEARVHVGHREEEDEHVVYVSDNGVGFDMKYVGKLFGVFQRLHKMEDFEGTGIGLANVRRIISRHGGRTWAEGKPGEGATVFFTLPKPTPEDKENHG